MEVEDRNIEWHKLSPPYATWTLSRPEWLSDDEVLIPVEVAFEHAVLSVELNTGETDVWENAEQELQRVIPICTSDDDHLAVFCDFEDRRPYRRLMRVKFERRAP